MAALASTVILLIGSVSFADYADGWRTEQETKKLSEAVKVWRRSAWQQDDFISQIRLGDLYSQNQSLISLQNQKPNGVEETIDPSYYDPVEAYVWYFVALRPYHRYGVNDNAAAMNDLYNIWSAANGYANSLYNTLTFEQRLEARARIIYILQSRGAEGFFTLGRLHYNGTPVAAPAPASPKPYVRACWRSWWARGPIRQGAWSVWAWLWTLPDPRPPYWIWIKSTQENYNSPDHLVPDEVYCRHKESPPEPPENRLVQGAGNPNVAIQQYDNGGGGVPLVMAPNANNAAQQQFGNQAGGGSASWSLTSVFTTDDLEAFVYFKRASDLGHPIAGSYADAIQSTGQYSSEIIAEAKKRAQYWAPPFEYYPGITPGGLIHSDESVPSLEQRFALGRVNEIPFRAVRDALAFRGLLKRYGCGPPPVCFRLAVMAFQKALDFQPTGLLTPPEAVRLIQMSANDGHADSQYRLGIMYAKGIGVPQNYPRAEKWFLKAANQQHADALFSLYLLYMTGPGGIGQDKDKANGTYLRATEVGRNFRERCELPDLLTALDKAGHDFPDGAKQ